MSTSQLPYTLRDATVEDMAQVRDIYAHYVLNTTRTFELEPPDVEEMVRRFKKAFGYFVVQENGTGRILGYAYCFEYRPRKAYDLTCEESVYVHPDAHRRGVGSALMKHIISFARDLGKREILAVIGGGPEINGPSCSFHASHGFKQVGLLPGVGYKFGQYLDSCIMQFSVRPSGGENQSS